jgi:alpha-beta hydrolase superfamily lysophospholipase
LSLTFDSLFFFWDIKGMQKRVLFLLAIVNLLSCTTGERQNYAFQDRSIQRSTVETIENTLQYYPQDIDQNWEDYLRYYNFDPMQFEQIHVGKISQEGYPYEVAVLALEQGDAHGSVFLVHGYLDHTSLNADFMTHLYEAGWNVYGIDMPGHGFSSGVRARIENFDQYGRMMNLVLTRVNPDFQKPLLMMGHSTGGSAIMNYLMTAPNNEADGVCLFAPLVQPQSWTLANVGLFLLDWAVEEVPSAGDFHTSNRDYLEFSKRQDPQLITKVDLSWVRATGEWIEEFKTYESGPEIPIKVIQGTKDYVVYADYNIPEIERVFPVVEVYYIPEGHHSLLNEPTEIRRQVYDAVDVFLQRFTQ